MKYVCYSIKMMATGGNLVTDNSWRTTMHKWIRSGVEVVKEFTYPLPLDLRLYAMTTKISATQCSFGRYLGNSAMEMSCIFPFDCSSRDEFIDCYSVPFGPCWDAYITPISRETRLATFPQPRHWAWSHVISWDITTSSPLLVYCTSQCPNIL